MTNEKILKKLHDKFDASFEDIIEAVKKYSKASDIKLLKHAYDFGLDAHKKQRRYSGEPYYEHCLNVAAILADLRMDTNTIAAGLLHDVVEDTGVTLAEVSEQFGEDVAKLVDGVTKISELKLESREKRQAETFRKMLLSMATDVRVIIIKFADRLHNMRTLEHVPQKKRQRIAIETRDVYAPLAHRFGIAKIKWELEDLVLKHLDEDSYNDINRKINTRREQRESYIQAITDPIQKELKAIKIKASVSGRPKHFFSIYNKMQKRNKPFEEIYDLLAIRIIVDKIETCYYVLGIVHNLYHPVYDRFKDYIAMPKLNGYQSLHTTVVGPNGKMVEIQIRTREMHRTAEIGIAAHWLYKEGSSSEEDYTKHMEWLHGLIDRQMEEEDPQDFMESLKIDLFQDEVFVFSPKGDLYKLPHKSTPIDFAFQIHTDVGIHCIGAKVNGKIVPLKSKLKSGDQVEIITSSNQEPHQDWLSFVKTSKARQVIKRYLRDTQQAQIIKLGEEILVRYLKKYSMETNSPEFVKIIPKLGFKNLDSLLLILGRGEYSTDTITDKLFPDEVPKEKRESFFSKYLKRARSGTGIRVQGMQDMMLNFAKCCQPVPGDKIVGFITQGRGISIHRIDCSNVVRLGDNNDKTIEVSWDIEGEQNFEVHLSIISEDRRDLLTDVTQAISKCETNIVMVEFKVDDLFAKGNVVIQVKDLYHLTKVLNSIRKINGILSVERVDGAVFTDQMN